MRKMSLETSKKSNGGSYHCDYCGWATWGSGAMKSHQRAAHGVKRYWWSPGYAYHFHWIGSYNCYTECGA